MDGVMTERQQPRQGRALPPSRPRPNVSVDQSSRDYDRVFPGQVAAMG
jgi:hypothetical protein